MGIQAVTRVKQAKESSALKLPAVLNLMQSFAFVITGNLLMYVITCAPRTVQSSAVNSICHHERFGYLLTVFLMMNTAIAAILLYSCVWNEAQHAERQLRLKLTCWLLPVVQACDCTKEHFSCA
jgi:hypothetical protein